MIDIEISSDRPTIALRMPAERRSLAIARQAVRSLGEALEAELGVLQAAELTVTDSCARAIDHARSRRAGTIELRLRPHGRLLRAEVLGPGGQASLLLGLGARAGRGTAPPAYARAKERMVRRVTAMFAARVDLPSDRLVEALLVGELVARHAPARVPDGRLLLRLDEHGNGLRFRVGRLARGGARGLLRDAALPVVGSVIERLADSVQVEHGSGSGRPPGGTGESLVLAIAA